MGSRVAEFVKCAVVVVAQVIASLMVASVIGLTCRATEDLGFHLRLGGLRAREEPARCDALVEKRTIVGPAIEGRRRRGKVRATEIVEKTRLDLGRAGWADRPALRAVAVIDEAHRVRG